MDHYIEVILKKREYIEKLETQIMELDQQLNGLNDLFHQVNLENVKNYEALNGCEVYHKEYEINAVVLVIAAILFLFSACSFPLVIYFHLDVLISFFAILGFNIINLGCAFGVTKLVSKRFQKLREKNQEQIQFYQNEIERVNEKAKDVEGKRQILIKKKQELALQITLEEKDIEQIKQALIKGLLKASKEQLAQLNPILDELILQEINKKEDVVIDLSIKKERLLE